MAQTTQHRWGGSHTIKNNIVVWLNMISLGILCLSFFFRQETAESTHCKCTRKFLQIFKCFIPFGTILEMVFPSPAFSYKWIHILFSMMSNHLYNPSQRCPILYCTEPHPFFCWWAAKNALVARSLFYTVCFTGMFRLNLVKLSIHFLFDFYSQPVGWMSRSDASVFVLWS